MLLRVKKIESSEYGVSPDGSVWSPRGNRRKAYRHRARCGTYLRCMIRVNGRKRNMRVHRLVAMAYLERKAGQVEVDHINGDTLDNRVENLRWVTRSENARARDKRIRGVP